MATDKPVFLKVSMKNEISIPILRAQLEVNSADAVAYLKGQTKFEKPKAQALADLNEQLAKKWRDIHGPGQAPKLAEGNVQFSVVTSR